MSENFMKYIKNPKIVMYPLLISLLITMFGVFLFPSFFEKGIDEPSTGETVLFFFLMVGLAMTSVVLCTSWFYEVRKSVVSVKGKRFSRLGVCASLILYLLGFVLALSMVSGILAVLIDALFQKSLAFSQIKGIINVTTFVLVLVTLPLAANVVGTFAFEELSAWQAIGMSVKKWKQNYALLLIWLIGSFVVGFIFTMALGGISQAWIVKGMVTVIYTLLGGLMGTAILAIVQKSVVQSEQAVKKRVA